MASQSVWIGITVGVFFVGIGIGYAVFTSPINFNSMTPQMFDHMMSNHQFMQNMMSNQQFQQQYMGPWMMQNPQIMQDMMIQNPAHIPLMAKTMKENHEFMQEMMTTIINDPDLRLQMLRHMSENQEAMKQMSEMMQGNMTDMMMGGK